MLMIVTLFVQRSQFSTTDTIPIIEKIPLDKTSDGKEVTTAPAITVKVTDIFNKRNITSVTPYLVHVDLTKQQITVYKTINGINTPIRTMLCATGKRHTPTPKGVFKMKHVGKFLFDRKYNCYLRYVVRFSGSYLIHSVPVNSKGRVLDRTIGKPASHGCIRLLVEDSKWLYQMPENTTVLIDK